MLKHYARLVLRTLRRQPGYAALNVLGLAVGVACCLFLLLYVRDELRYDRHHAHAEDVYRVNMHIEQAGGDIGVTPTVVAPLLKREFPEVVAATRIEANGGVVRVGERVLDDNAFYFADSTYFDVFTHPFLAGDPRTALARPYTVVLTRATAEKYFGDADPVGQTLLRNNDEAYEVTGVIEDLPTTSHFTFDFLGSFASREQWAGAENEQWSSANFFTFVRLAPGTPRAPFQGKLDAYLARREAAGEEYRALVLQPLVDIHLDTHVVFDLDDTGDVAYVYGFATVALLILLIACINYMNLATARSALRAREVGVRKALGAARGQLVGQFYAESAALTLAGLVLAVGLVAAGIGWFNALSGKALSLGTLAEPGLLALIAGVFVVVSVVAGSYPAFYLSAFEPVRVLRGRARAGRGAAALRKGLVVLQFGISAFLIAGTLVVMSQLRYLRTQTVGFDKEHVVTLPLTDPVLQAAYPALKAAVRESPAVVAAAGINQLPGQLGWTSQFRAEGLAEEDEFLIKGLPADADVIDGLGIPLAAGRGFEGELPEPDSGRYRIILNEAAVARLGWTVEDAVGRRAAVDVRWGEVVGVAQDFHYRSLREAIEPLAIWYEPGEAAHLAVRLAPGQTAAAMRHLESTWQRFAPHRPFSYRFLDDVYDRQYRNEQQMGSVVSVFAFLAVFVACLGLFGLAAFTAEVRTREVGVRKVLGASVPHLVGLLAKDFLVLVAVAFVLAVPAAWWGVGAWLDGFAYRVGLGPLPFALAGGLLLAIALLTVSTQALRAATADPVRALRAE